MAFLMTALRAHAIAGRAGRSPSSRTIGALSPSALATTAASSATALSTSVHAFFLSSIVQVHPNRDSNHAELF
jgi:hypothetical protein